MSIADRKNMTLAQVSEMSLQEIELWGEYYTHIADQQRN